LRSFLQYGRYRGDIRLDLAAAVPLVANFHVVDSSGNCTRSSAPAVGSNRSTHRGRATRLCDLAAACAVGSAFQ
jgi:hypothetical protein